MVLGWHQLPFEARLRCNINGNNLQQSMLQGQTFGKVQLVEFYSIICIILQYGISIVQT